MAGRPLSVVITGASAGVGRATAIRFARAGARVCALARSPSGLDGVKRDIEENGGEAMAIPLDVSDCAALMAAAEEVSRRWGGIDVWINNAMATMFAPVSRMTGEEYARITNVTYLGYVYGTMAALSQMRGRNGATIVQVGSALAYRAIPLQSAYCGAKFAVRAFTDALRSELAHEQSGVRLTMIQLPAVNTPQFDWARNRMEGRPRPVPPVFEPEDIAEIIYRAAHEPPRELWVGAPTLKIIAGNIAVPGWLDRFLAKAGYRDQIAAGGDGASEGNLFAPSEGEHKMRGRFGDETKPRPLAIDPALLRLGAAGLALAAVVAAVLLAL